MCRPRRGDICYVLRSCSRTFLAGYRLVDSKKRRYWAGTGRAGALALREFGFCTGIRPAWCCVRANRPSAVLRLRIGESKWGQIKIQEDPLFGARNAPTKFCSDPFCGLCLAPDPPPRPASPAQPSQPPPANGSLGKPLTPQTVALRLSRPVGYTG